MRIDQLNTLSIVVMCHPSRRERAEEVARRIGPSVRIVEDPDPGGAPNAVRCAELAWRTIEPGATHHLVVQDDAYVCRDFLERVGTAIRARPASAVGLFLGWSSGHASAGRQALIKGAGFVEIVTFFASTTAVVMPRLMAEGFSRYMVENIKRSAVGDSIMLREYLTAHGTEYLAYLPSLVDHDRPRIDSVLGNDSAKGLRRAMCFIDDVDFAPGSGSFPHPRWRPQLSPGTLEPVVESTSETVPLRTWLAHRGHDIRALEEAAASSFLPTHLEHLRRERLLDLWAVGYAHGLLAVGSVSPDTEVLVRARGAVASLFPGAYRRILPDDVLVGLAPVMADVPLAGFRAGLVAGSEGS